MKERRVKLLEVLSTSACFSLETLFIYNYIHSFQFSLDRAMRNRTGNLQYDPWRLGWQWA
jgi:hypothetical protein